MNHRKIIRSCHDTKRGCSKHAGLGDKVERIAQPIARIIDKALGTNIQSCGGCQQRKALLNKHFPSKT